MQNYRLLSPLRSPGKPTAKSQQQQADSSPAVGAVRFSLDSDDIYFPPQTLVLSCDTPGAHVRYAIDTDTLSPDAPIFDPAHPLILTQNTQVVAQAFKGEISGPLSIASYAIKAAVWQKLEPEDQSDATPHEVQDSASLPKGWKLAAASRRGRLHAHRAQWREDSFAWGQSNDGAFAVVSDGAGSAPLSRVGAALICQSVKQHLETGLANWQWSAPDEFGEQDAPQLRRLLAESAQEALTTLRHESERRGRPVDEFAATLLIFLIIPWYKTHVYATFQVGDGAIALYDHRSSINKLGIADAGYYAGETRFLTTTGIEQELEARVSIGFLRESHAVALMTDGVADDFFPASQHLGELFQTLLPQLNVAENAGAALLDWLGYEKKGSSDDRTFVMLWDSQVGLNTSP